jgi:hypothetical protein
MGWLALTGGELSVVEQVVLMYVRTIWMLRL